MLDKEISELLAYAQTHLMLDALDSARAARTICRLLMIDGCELLGADEIDLDAIDAMTEPDALVAPVIAYAEQNGIPAQSLKAEIMDALSLKPSELNDLFADTYAVNKQKAFDFLYEYSVKDGYVDLCECAKNDRWEAKELKSKIEIIINLMPQKQGIGAYCPLCKELEGYSDYANMRKIATDIDGEEWFFNYSRHQYYEKHGVLANGKHTPMTEGKDAVKKLALAADFIGSDGFVGTNSLAENGGANNVAHEHFQTGFRSTPMLKAATKARLKSKEYPYLEMNLVDWYGTVVRIAHSNLEKTVEFVDKLAAAWKAYSDERITNDGKKNFCNVVARKTASGKYCFDVVLRSNALKKPRMGAEFDEIKSGALSLNDVMGYFVLPTKLSEQLKQVQLYLDGTMPFDAANMPATIKPFAKMIERMLGEQGGTVSKLEAKLNVHDEIDAACEKILAATAIDGASLSAFLSSLDIATIG